jgi:hypothetical protein
MASSKKERGQFYTKNSDYILDGFILPPGVDIIEPFAGQGDLIDWIDPHRKIISYDIEPKRGDIIQRDTLLDPPDYSNSWIITNPPFLARNKSKDKVYFDMYNTNDLYKCFIHSINSCLGGIFIIPAGFFLSPRNIDVVCRNNFLSKYRLLKVKYFEETVFSDTTTTVVAFSFEKSKEPLTEQTVVWQMMPSGTEKQATMKKSNDWIIGGEIYKLPVSRHIKISRHVHGQSTDNTTSLTLCALDSGRVSRIRLDYRPGYIYPAKDCSRSYATINITGVVLSPEQQQQLSLAFNEYIENFRQQTSSLFLPQYRESKEYSRKRIPFDLAYRLINYLLDNM